MVQCSARELKAASSILAHSSFLVRGIALSLTKQNYMAYKCLVRGDSLITLDQMEDVSLAKNGKAKAISKTRSAIGMFEKKGSKDVSCIRLEGT